MNKFQIGDKVKWTREKVRVYKRVKETNSFTKKEKPQVWLTGIVEEILQPGERRMSGYPAREHLSYLVRVGGRLFQPPVSRLEAAE